MAWKDWEGPMWGRLSRGRETMKNLSFISLYSAMALLLKKQVMNTEIKPGNLPIYLVQKILPRNVH